MSFAKNEDEDEEENDELLKSLYGNRKRFNPDLLATMPTPSASEVLGIDNTYNLIDAVTDSTRLASLLLEPTASEVGGIENTYDLLKSSSSARHKPPQTPHNTGVNLEDLTKRFVEGLYTGEKNEQHFDLETFVLTNIEMEKDQEQRELRKQGGYNTMSTLSRMLNGGSSRNQLNEDRRLTESQREFIFSDDERNNRKLLDFDNIQWPEFDTEWYDMDADSESTKKKKNLFYNLS